MHPEHRSIGELAYRLWQSAAARKGAPRRDWLDAEKQLRSAQRTDEPPPNADAKWKAAGASRASSGGSVAPLEICAREIGARQAECRTTGLINNVRQTAG